MLSSHSVLLTDDAISVWESNPHRGACLTIRMIYYCRYYISHFCKAKYAIKLGFNVALTAFQKWYSKNCHFVVYDVFFLSEASTKDFCVNIYFDFSAYDNVSSALEISAIFVFIIRMRKCRRN